MLYKLTFHSKKYIDMSWETLFIETDDPLLALEIGRKHLKKKFPKDAKKGIYLDNLERVAEKVIR